MNFLTKTKLHLFFFIFKELVFEELKADGLKLFEIIFAMLIAFLLPNFFQGEVTILSSMIIFFSYFLIKLLIFLPVKSIFKYNKMGSSFEGKLIFENQILIHSEFHRFEGEGEIRVKLPKFTSNLKTTFKVVSSNTNAVEAGICKLPFMNLKNGIFNSINGISSCTISIQKSYVNIHYIAKPKADPSEIKLFITAIEPIHRLT